MTCVNQASPVFLEPSLAHRFESNGNPRQSRNSILLMCTDVQFGFVSLFLLYSLEMRTINERELDNSID